MPLITGGLTTGGLTTGHLDTAGSRDACRAMRKRDKEEHDANNRKRVAAGLKPCKRRKLRPCP